MSDIMSEVVVSDCGLRVFKLTESVALSLNGFGPGPGGPGGSRWFNESAMALRQGREGCDRAARLAGE
jgi:hypothetical protein